MKDEFFAFLAQPYSDDMDAFHWFLFFGFIIALSVMWGLILRTLGEVTSA